jgi:ABC-type Fe3+-siderophore transport system permease subunit
MFAQNAADNPFFTPESLGTLAGASLAAMVAANVFGSFFSDPTTNKSVRKWAALIISFFVSAGLLLFWGPDVITGQDWLLAILNALLIFATAAGINQLATGTSVSGRGREGQPGLKAGWF